MVYFILPSFMTLIDNSSADIPALTKAVINMTEFMRTKWYIIIAAIIIAAVLFKYYTGRGKLRIIYHRLLLKLPVLGKVIRKITASRFSRTLGMLQKSGIPLISSLESVRNIVGNGVAEEAIDRAITAVKNGQGLAAPLEASGVFETVLVKMVQVGEETGSLDEMLIKTADYFDSEVETGLNQLMQVIEPAMLILMGAIVGTIVIAMLMPMYGMLNNLGI
jgi:type IV pilus assembly protein PilC